MRRVYVGPAGSDPSDLSQFKELPTAEQPDFFTRHEMKVGDRIVIGRAGRDGYRQVDYTVTHVTQLPDGTWRTTVKQIAIRRKCEG